MTCRHIHMVILIIILLNCSDCSPPSIFQSGIRTLYLQKSLDDMESSSPGATFTINFEKLFTMPPLTLIAPLTYEYDQASQKEITHTGWSRVSTKVVSVEPSKLYLKISRTTNNIIYLRASYLFLEYAVSKKVGLFFLKHNYQQYNGALLTQQKGSITIEQISYNRKQKKSSQKTFSVALPSKVNEYKPYIFINELIINQNEPISYELSTRIKEESIEVIFSYDFDQKKEHRLQFPSYMLIIVKESQQQKPSFEKITFSVPQQVFSQKIAQSLFIGLTKIQTEISALISSVNFLNIDSSIFIRKQIKTYGQISLQLTSIKNIQLQTYQGQSYVSRLLLTCSAPKYPTFFVNYWSTWVDPVNSSLQTCQPCPTGCYNCYYCNSCLHFVNCSMCYSGFSLVKLGVNTYPNSQRVCKCPSGSFQSQATQTCVACSVAIPNCASCVVDSSGHFGATCATCSSRYFGSATTTATDGYTTCSPCTYGCLTCTGTATNCSTCASGFKLSAGICVCATAGTFYNSLTLTCQTCATIYPNCATCVQSGSVTTCSVCASKYYLSSNGTCVACTTYCLNCTQSVCLTCMATFLVSGTSCVCSTTPQALLNTVTKTCILCTTSIPLCATCSISGSTITCVSCSVGSFPTSSTVCTACPTLCTSCTSSTVCQTCVNNLIPNPNLCGCDNTAGSYLNILTNTCVSCSQTFPQCATCTTSGTLACATCINGTYLSGGSCYTCPFSCTSCTSNTVCTTCITGYVLSYNVTNMCGCPYCSSCTYYNVTNCAVCDYTNITNAFCLTCDIGYYLVNGTCYQCPLQCATCTSATVCQTCKSPFIPSTPAGSCVCNSLLLLYYNPVGPTCSSCLTIPGMSTNCTACQSVGNVTSCTSCTSGNYVSSGNCAICPFPCATCTSASVCTSCWATFVLINSTCTCDTDRQIFRNTIPTPDVCSDCTTITTTLCVTCVENANATLTSGIACSVCAPGYYINSTFLCQQCPTTCTVCSGPTACTECLDTYSLISGSCKCDTANGVFFYGDKCMACYSIINYCQTCTNSTGTVICSACGTGTYLNSDGYCTLCQINCDNCTSAGCTVCSSGYLLNAGKCQCKTTCLAYSTANPYCVDCALSTDPVTNTSTLLCMACKMSTFVVSNTNCNACPTTCATCSNYITCLTCIPSFTLINNNCVCNEEAYQMAYGSVCKSCGELVPGCKTCTVSGLIATCTQCIDGWGLQSGTCTYCGLGCKICTVNLTIPTCTACYTDAGQYSLFGSTCMNNTACINSNGLFFNSTSLNVTYCDPCMANCKTCYNKDTCVQCLPTFSYLKDKCVCNNGLNLFLDKNSSTCITCQSAVNGTVSYLVNCKFCRQSTTDYPIIGIECKQCNDGFYVSLGTCQACANGCQKCTSNTACCSCITPLWTMANATCVCNNDLNYFTDGNSSCLPCAIANCTVCQALNTCLVCNFDSFVNTSGLCQLSVCGNGVTEGNEQCDDGNTIAGDGCSATCLVETFYYCVNVPTPSVCRIDSRFKIKVTQIIAGCNQITFNFQIYPYYSYYDNANFTRFLYTNSLNSSTSQISLQKSYDIVSYTFSFSQTIQSLPIEIIFDPSNLQINQTIGYPTNVLNFVVQPTNNVLAHYYDGDVCQSADTLAKLATFIEYGSYGVLLASVLPAKIVGLQLFGVLQLAFFSLGSMDNVNIMMSPMMGMKGVNGFALSLGKDPSKARLLQTQTLTPQRIHSIGYQSNFLRNCNVMLLLILTIIVVAFCLYMISFIIKKCSITLYKISKRLIKEVLLTLILFNCLNFAYSAGIHFRYAIPEDDLYLLGTLAAGATLVIPIMMAIALSMTEEDGFGEFKEKLKQNCINKAYFVFTIIYRMSLGIYMSTSNEDQLSTLIVLAISILFLLYNLVNLPFTKAYHNYRANICHFCQFIVLFIAMYYRSMKSTVSREQVAGIFSPVYLEYTCIMVSLVVSLVVLIYDIYIWVKECNKEDGKNDKQSNNQRSRRLSDISEAENKMNPTLVQIHDDQNEKDKTFCLEVHDDNEIYN